MISRTPLPSANKAAHSGFETQRRRYQKSKTGYQWSQKWKCVYQKLKKYKKTLLSIKSLLSDKILPTTKSLALAQFLAIGKHFVGEDHDFWSMKFNHSQVVIFSKSK